MAFCLKAMWEFGPFPLVAPLLPSQEGGWHSLTLARGPTRRLPPWPAGTQTRCMTGQMRSAGRNRLPRGRRAAGSAKGQELGSLRHRPSQVHGSCEAQEKDTRPSALTHLPAAVAVGQEPEHYAEHHVAKKHHLRGIGTQLWRAHSQTHGAALLFELRVSCVFSGQQDELWPPAPQGRGFQGVASFVQAFTAATLKAGGGWQGFQNKNVEVGICFGITCSGHGHLLSSASLLMSAVSALFLSP